MKIPFIVQLLEPPYHLAQIFGGFGQGEHHARKQSLLIDEVATVAVLKHHIVVIVVFQEIMQFFCGGGGEINSATVYQLAIP